MITRFLHAWAKLDVRAVEAGPRILLSVVADALGSGLTLSILPIYFAARSGLTVATVSGLMTVAAIVALPTGSLTVRPLRRFGSAELIRSVNLFRAGVCVLALFAGHPWLVLLALVLSTACDNAFWTANSVMIAEVAGEQRRRWFAVERSVRNAAIGVGAVVAGAVLSFGGTGSLHVLVLANGVAFAVAGLLLLGVRTAESARRRTTVEAGDRRARRRTLGAALLPVVGLSVALAIPILALPTVLTVSLQGSIERGALIAGLMVAVAVTLIVVLQPRVTVLSERVSHRRTLVLAGVADALGAAALVVTALRSDGVALTVVAAVVGTVLLTLGEMATNAALNDFVVVIAPLHLREAYLAGYQSSWAVAAILWPVAVLSWADARPWLSWVVLIGLGTCGAVLAARIPVGRTGGVAARAPVDSEAHA